MKLSEKALKQISCCVTRFYNRTFCCSNKIIKRNARLWFFATILLSAAAGLGCCDCEKRNPSFFLKSRHVAEKVSAENRDSESSANTTGSQREETAEEVILQRLLRQMKLPVFALQAFLQHRQFITIKKSIFYIDLHSSKPNEPRQRHFSVSPSFCQMIWENI